MSRFTNGSEDAAILIDPRIKPISNQREVVKMLQELDLPREKNQIPPILEGFLKKLQRGSSQKDISLKLDFLERAAHEVGLPHALGFYFLQIRTKLFLPASDYEFRPVLPKGKIPLEDQWNPVRRSGNGGVWI